MGKKAEGPGKNAGNCKMNKKQIANDLCEYILQRYGIEMYGVPEIEEITKKIVFSIKKSSKTLDC